MKLVDRKLPVRSKPFPAPPSKFASLLGDDVDVVSGTRNMSHIIPLVSDELANSTVIRRETQAIFSTHNNKALNRRSPYNRHIKFSWIS
jgi:hypothetical protein